VINNDMRIIYDSHKRRLLGPRFSQEYVVDHPEVLEALKYGVGYSEDYSELQEEKFSYLAKAFDFHGKIYVMRTAFPDKYFNDLTRDFEIAFLTAITAILLLFSALTWFFINRLTNPIQQIINAVVPYQEGLQTGILEIQLKKANSKDEFNMLAMTLNSLSSKIQKHIFSLTQERNEKEAILESLIEGVIAVDSDMHITYANDMAVKQLDMPRESLLGQKFNITHQAKCYDLLTRCQADKVVLTDDLTITKDNSSKIYLDVLAAPKGASQGAILVMQDKSTHYKLLEMRKDFIANASHELKTPITIIRGFAETLHDNPGLPIDVRISVTEKIVNNCQRMTTLIKDLLTLSDVENIPLSRLDEFDVYELLEKCCSDILRVYSDAHINLYRTPEEAMLIIADESLIELALMNLIENAAKYSQNPAQINIHVEKIEKNIKLTIADKGIGIPEADLEHIFERFYTVNKAHSRKMGGSGLGLSLVHTIIQKHFGKITVQSEIGKGTVFTIILEEAARERLRDEG
jgi:two-component system phosphate regulon sensor histidine kinase PhoR